MPAPGTWVPAVHSVCSHNEALALLKRTLGPTPSTDVGARAPVFRSFRWLRSVCTRYTGQRWTLLETAQSYSGSLRRRYLQAEESLRVDGPLRSSDRQLQAFLKAEKFQPGAKFSKPRMIFPRSPRYNLSLASWLKPFEHWLWGNLKSEVSWGVPPTRVVAKGLNPEQRANLIRRKMGQVGDGCEVFEVDAKSFESHVDRWQIVQEHLCYLSAFDGDAELAGLLRVQEVLSGRTSLGHRFEREGGRASGDFNTGMGNSLVFLAVLRGCLLGRVPRFDLLVDGDNALVFLPSGCLDPGFAGRVLRCSGHELEVEKRTTVLERVVFGQSRPVFDGSSWRMVRDWRKVLSGAGCSHVHLKGPLPTVLRYLSGVGKCELAINAGLPVLGRFSYLLSRLGSGSASAEMYRDYRYLGVDVDRVLGEVGVEVEVTDEARKSFEVAFGVTSGDQVRLERNLDLNVQIEEVRLESPDFGDLFRSSPGLLPDLFADPTHVDGAGCSGYGGWD